jgi:hypothetical protein
LKGICLKTSHYLAVAAVVAAGMCFYCGCGIEEPAERFWFEAKPYTNKQSKAYRPIELRKTTSAEILENIKLYKPELISQSESVVACWAEKKETHQFWLNMVAFEEETATVARKYFLAIDEKPWHIHNESQNLRFDCEIAYDQNALSQPYTSVNERRIAICKGVLEIVRDDFLDVRQDSRVLNEGAMMTNQVFERILYVMSQSPGLAYKLGDPNGLDYDHLTFGKSLAGLYIDDVNNIVRIKIRTGSAKRLWKLK